MKVRPKANWAGLICHTDQATRYCHSILHGALGSSGVPSCQQSPRGSPGSTLYSWWLWVLSMQYASSLVWLLNDDECPCLGTHMQVATMRLIAVRTSREMFNNGFVRCWKQCKRLCL